MKTPNEYNVPKWLRILFSPLMIVASAIATVAYGCTMFLTIFVIQTVGLIVMIFSFFKYLHGLVLRLFTPAPAPPLPVHSAR